MNPNRYRLAKILVVLFPLLLRVLLYAACSGGGISIGIPVVTGTGGDTTGTIAGGAAEDPGVGSTDTGTTDTGTTGVTIDPLSSDESQLFETGPVDLPVTLAKLESPDSGKISVSYALAAQSLSAPRVRTVQTGVTYTFTFIGTAGAVQDPTLTPYVLLGNTQTGTQITADVSADGSFEVSLDGEAEQDFVLTSLSTNDLTTAQAGPLLIYRLNADGNIIIRNTNSNVIDIFTTIVVDNEGNSYFTIANADGTWTLFRRDTAGGLPIIVYSQFDSRVRLITVADDERIIVMEDNGTLLSIPVTSSVATLVKGHTRLQATTSTPTYGEPAVIGAYNDISAAPTNDKIEYELQAVPGLGFFVTYSQSYLYATGYTGAIYEFYPSGSNDPVTLISYTGGDVANREDIHAWAMSDGKVYVLLTFDLGGNVYDSSLYQLNVSGSSWTPADAWTNRTALFEHEDLQTYDLAATDDGTVVIGGGYWKVGGMQYTGYRTWNAGLGFQDLVAATAQSPGFPSMWFRLAPAGDYLLTCSIPSTGWTDSDALIISMRAATRGQIFNIGTIPMCLTLNGTLDLSPDGRVHMYAIDLASITIPDGADSFSDLSFNAQISTFDVNSLDF